MRASSPGVSLSGFTLLWVLCTINLAFAITNSTASDARSTTPSPPYSLEDVNILPGNAHHLRPPPSIVAGCYITRPRSQNAREPSGSAPFEGFQVVRDFKKGKTRIWTPRTPSKKIQKVVVDYRRQRGIKRACHHSRLHVSCTYGVPPHEFEKMMQAAPTDEAARIFNCSGTDLSANVQVFRYGGSEGLEPALVESSSGSPPWPNFTQPMSMDWSASKKLPVLYEGLTAPFAESTHGFPPWPNSSQPILEERSAFKKVPELYKDEIPSCIAGVQEPQTQPITQDQLIDEVKGIYAGLVMVEKKCVEIDEEQQQRSLSNKLPEEQWQALISLHRTLLYEQHDVFLASQHPSSSAAHRRLATKYAMSAHVWRHGIHSFLELLRHRLQDPLDHMIAFLHLAYSMMALLEESVPSFTETWTECLGELDRYLTAIEEVDLRDREIWSGCARMWYEKAADKSPNSAGIQYQRAVLARPTIRRRTQQRHHDPEPPLSEKPVSKGMFGSQVSPKGPSVSQVGDSNEVLDIPFLPGAGAGDFETVQEPFVSSLREESTINDALNGIETFSGLMGEYFIDGPAQDTDMPDFTFDAVERPQSPETSQEDPLSNVYLPEITSMDIDDPTSAPAGPQEDYGSDEMDWDPEFDNFFDVHIVHEIIESIPFSVLHQKPISIIQPKPKNEDDDSKTIGQVLQIPAKTNAGVIDRSEALPDEFGITNFQNMMAAILELHQRLLTSPLRTLR